MLLPKAEIRKKITLLENREEELKTEEERLSQQVTDVQESLRRVRFEKAELISRAAPISDLPVEVLSYIFSFLKDGSRSSYGLPDLITITHVASRWRRAAIGEPSLWTTIDVDCSRLSKEAFTAYFSRSRLCLLDVTFKVHRALNNLSDDEFVKFFMANRIMDEAKQICAHFDRILTLSIDCKDAERELSHFARLFSSLSAPVLRHFQVNFYDGIQNPEHWDNSTGSNRIFAGGAPALASLVLLGIGLRCCWPPLSAITHLHLEDRETSLALDLHSFRDAMASCTSLLHFEVQGRIFLTEIGGEISPIDAHTLVSLTVVSLLHRVDIFFPITLGTIITPDLTTLCIKHAAPLQFIKFIELVKSQSPFLNLQTLRLESTKAIEAIDFDFIRSLSSVSHVAIKHSQGHHSMYLQIAWLLSFLETRDSQGPPPANTLLWPNLKILSLSAFEAETLRKFLNYRIEVQAPLSTLRFDSRRNIADEDMIWFRERVQVEMVSLEYL